MKRTPASTRTVDVSQGGVVDRDLLVVDIRDMDDAQGTRPRNFVFILIHVCLSCR